MRRIRRQRLRSFEESRSAARDKGATRLSDEHQNGEAAATGPRPLDALLRRLHVPWRDHAAITPRTLLRARRTLRATSVLMTLSGLIGVQMVALLVPIVLFGHPGCPPGIRESTWFCLRSPEARAWCGEGEGTHPASASANGTGRTL